MEWFWRGRALADAHRSWPAFSDRAAQLAWRARKSADTASSILLPADPDDAEARATACELYRQAAYWALAALAAHAGSVIESTYSIQVWDTLEESVLAAAAETSERSDALKATLRSGSFVSFAELPKPEQLAVGTELQRLCKALFAKLDQRAHALQLVYFSRAWRLFLIPLAVATVLVGMFFWHESRDLVAGKPWHTSSKYPSYGCQSPAQQCDESPFIFFHTESEKSPWIEFDIGAVHDISSAKIVNRTDAYTDRAFPLVLEVSTDDKNWKTIAHKDEDFNEWRTSFSSVPARYVRLRALKQTWLHLSRVRIFP